MLVPANKFRATRCHLVFTIIIILPTGHLNLYYCQSSGYVGTNIPSKLSKNVYSLDSLVGMTFDLLLTFDQIELNSVFNNFNRRLW